MADNRNLTDADVKAIASEIERSIMQRFQLNVGQGVLRFVWRAMIYAMIALAAYGAAGGFKKLSI